MKAVYSALLAISLTASVGCHVIDNFLVNGISFHRNSIHAAIRLTDSQPDKTAIRNGYIKIFLSSQTGPRGPGKEVWFADIQSSESPYKVEFNGWPAEEVEMRVQAYGSANYIMGIASTKIKVDEGKTANVMIRIDLVESNGGVGAKIQFSE